MSQASGTTARSKGVVILTEGRSGSNWLGSLISGTGVLGVSREWFSRRGLEGAPQPATGAELEREVLARASTPNGFFAIKLFPAHVHRFERLYGYDLLHSLNQQHDILFVRLTRKDRIRQAVSFVRGLQTKKWTKLQAKGENVHYDFEAICRCYFMIDRSYAYWQSYCHLRQLREVHFAYEDMLPDPMPFVAAVANHAGVASIELPKSRHSVQRDEVTEEWVARFQADLPTSDVVPASATHGAPARTPANFLRFLRGRHLKPYPYQY